MQKRHSKRKILTLAWSLIVVGVVLAVIGGLLAWRQYRQNEAADKAAAAAEYRANHGHATGSIPSTIKPMPSAFASYTAPADQPRYLYIPKIGVQAIVRSVGLTADGAIDTPNNIYTTAWFKGSAKPGQPGATFIDGHVGFWNEKGIFWNLDELQTGDTIRVERGDGTVYTYAVVQKQIYSADDVDMTQVLAPIDATKSGLNLITCTGDVINGNDYNQRVVIFATQLPPN